MLKTIDVSSCNPERVVLDFTFLSSEPLSQLSSIQLSSAISQSRRCLLGCYVSLRFCQHLIARAMAVSAGTVKKRGVKPTQQEISSLLHFEAAVGRNVCEDDCPQSPHPYRLKALDESPCCTGIVFQIDCHIV